MSLFYNKQYSLLFESIAKNASTSIEPYLHQSGFKPILPKDLPDPAGDLPMFYILRNPIERFCSGIIESYCTVLDDNFGNSITQQTLMSMSDGAQQEFCYCLMMRIPPNNSPDRQPENNVPVNEGLGYKHDVHTQLQVTSATNLGTRIHRIIPVSIHLTSQLPQIFFEQTQHTSKQSLLTTAIEFKNQSLNDKKRLNNNLQLVLESSRNLAWCQHIWNYLEPDIKHWNSKLAQRYMQDHHMNEKII